MTFKKLIPLAGLAILAAAGCTHTESRGLVAPTTQAKPLEASATTEARRYIKERLELEGPGYRIKVDTLQLITPPFEDEYVFAATTMTTTGSGKDATILGRERIIGSVYMSPRKKFLIWKQRTLAKPAPSPAPPSQ